MTVKFLDNELFVVCEFLGDTFIIYLLEIAGGLWKGKRLLSVFSKNITTSKCW